MFISTLITWVIAVTDFISRKRSDVVVGYLQKVKNKYTGGMNGIRTCYFRVNINGQSRILKQKRIGFDCNFDNAYNLLYDSKRDRLLPHNWITGSWLVGCPIVLIVCIVMLFYYI